LLTPGPTIVPPSLCEALGRPLIHHRTPQFQSFYQEAVKGLQEIYQTQNDIYLMASSGTGIMEASVCSFLSPGDKVVTIEGGKFGERWTELCRVYNIETQVIAVEWGKAVDPESVRQALKADPQIKAVFATLCETSTGVTMDIEGLGQVVRESDAILVVDAISGLGVTEMKTDQWGVDVAVAAAHKGFMLPPGLSFASVSLKAIAMMESSSCPKFYLDLKKYKTAAAVSNTPFTPPIGIVVALTESLAIMKESGLKCLFAHYKRLALATRAAVQALGLSLLADPSCISNVLTAVIIPDSLDGGRIVKMMRDEHGITVAGGQAELKGKMLRIGHMGCVDEYDILAGISCLEKVLKELGHPFECGIGVAAAQRSLNPS